MRNDLFKGGVIHHMRRRKHIYQQIHALNSSHMHTRTHTQHRKHLHWEEQLSYLILKYYLLLHISHTFSSLTPLSLTPLTMCGVTPLLLNSFSYSLLLFTFVCKEDFMEEWEMTESNNKTLMRIMGLMFNMDLTMMITFPNVVYHLLFPMYVYLG